MEHLKGGREKWLFRYPQTTEVIIWELASAILLLISLRAVEAFMFDVVTAHAVASFI